MSSLQQIFSEIKQGPKHRCFVCGEEFVMYEEFCQHIFSKHDEGREYLRCPACDCPVRDMRLHYQAKHPSRPLPKDTQLKVSIWFDFKGNKRKARKLNFKEGNFVSQKMGGQTVHYRSSYELEVYKLLENEKTVVGYEAEPFKLPYYFGGKWLDYIPDLKVHFTDGSIQIWEVKPSNMTAFKKNKAKWTAMEEHAKKMGWQFKVITEQVMSRIKQEQIHG